MKVTWWGRPGSHELAAKVGLIRQHSERELPTQLARSSSPGACLWVSELLLWYTNCSQPLVYPPQCSPLEEWPSSTSAVKQTKEAMHRRHMRCKQKGCVCCELLLPAERSFAFSWHSGIRIQGRHRTKNHHHLPRPHFLFFRSTENCRDIEVVHRKVITCAWFWHHLQLM